MNENTEIMLGWGALIIGALCVLIMVIATAMWGMPRYHVWHQAQMGKAELARADYNRQIAVREAKAKEEAAVDLAGAEVERAKGVAKANHIIGKSLEGNEAYLRYLWINNLDQGKNQVIYVPTEANLPILEANRLHK